MNIKPSASIRNNYNEISALCKSTGEPVSYTHLQCSDRPYAGCGGRGSRTAAKKKPGKNCGRSPIEKTEDTEHDKTADESDCAGGA